MSRATIVEKDWPWTGELAQRDVTSYITIHHTTGPQMQDTNEIFQEHLAAGYIGIGYHFVVKGDGTIVRGRPIWSIGAHALGINYCSIGVALEGDYQPGDNGEYETPPDVQIDALVNLCADIMDEYGALRINGHRDAAALASKQPNDYATDCPGDTLYNMLYSIRSRVAELTA